jgi:hypothetical protein
MIGCNDRVRFHETGMSVMPLRRKIFAFLLPILLAASCAGAPERPVEQLTRAKTLIDQAEKTGASRFAAAELERARSKLSAAETAASEGEQETARQLATEAALDAEYAAALAKAGEARKAAEEVEKSVESLREESTRRPDGSVPDRP